MATIEDFQRLLNREKKAKTICSELNNFTDLRPTLISVMTNIKELTKIEAVGIRLHDKDDYPYYLYNGFPDQFILRENNLCSKDQYGRKIPDPDGKGYLLDCMCGNIIKGRYNPSLSFFTENGSFWTNSTSDLLASTTEEDRLARTRNYCNRCGYESVALVPIKAMGETIGLIQLNDKRTDMFKESLIHYLEMIGEQIGLAVKNSLMYTNLLESNKTKDKFLSIISHDLRSPFFALMGHIELINDHFDKFDRNQLKNEISTLQHLVKRYSHLMESLLTWSLIQREKMVLNPQEVNLRKMTADEIALLSEIAEKKNISVNNNLMDDIILFTDENAVTTILRNLISNAIKFTEPGGKVDITGKVVQNFAEIIVSDTGIGMDKEMITTLFDLDPKNKRLGTNRERGTGLGLKICHELIKILDGNIKVESEIGKGSSVIISIPL